MNKLPEHFTIEELVCQHVLDYYIPLGINPIEFFDHRLLETIVFLRGPEGLNTPFTVNNYSYPHEGETFTQRGLRCNICEIVENATKKKKPYVSAHVLAKAIDFDAKGYTAVEARKKIIALEPLLPYRIRLELNVNWVHLDVRDHNRTNKIYFFNK